VYIEVWFGDLKAIFRIPRTRMDELLAHSKRKIIKESKRELSRTRSTV